MKLTNDELLNKNQWIEKGYHIPEYNRQEVMNRTKKNPIWLHLGAGNIFRALPAKMHQQLLNEGETDKGIIVAEGFDYEIVEKAYRPFNNLSLLATLKSDGSIEKDVIGSVTESLLMNTYGDADFKRLQEVFEADSLQMVSLTITEKGYSLVDSKGEFLDVVKQDFESGPQEVVSYMGKIASLLYSRYKKSKSPIALVSMDNVSHNGALLKETIIKFTDAWIENELISSDFKEYLTDSTKVSFPWTMIDKITPHPDIAVQEILEEDGVEDISIIQTEKNSVTAPFVNAEEAEYLVIEDQFPNGRPSLEKAGIIFTDQETVDKIETMKVTTCLNPLHTALAIYGCLLGYETIYETMKDPNLVKLVKGVGYLEGLPVVVDPKIISPKNFIDEVFNVRLINPFIADTPQRIATDTSQKIAIRFGQTIKSYANKGKVEELEYIPLVLAGWLRYLMGINDQGNKMELSPDPLIDDIVAILNEISLGQSESIEEKIKPIIKRPEIFGVDLYNVGLASKVTFYFKKLIEKTGAVKNTLQDI